MKISVLICTYNGSKTISLCLNALFYQKTTLKYEVIVVNNNSIDNTKFEIYKFIEENKCSNIKYIDELTRGKVNALKTGILNSSGEIIIICDDDNILDLNYLDIAYVLMKDNLNYGLACGTNIAVSESPFPEWFTKYQLLYACGSLATESGLINDQIIWGAGMVGRGALLREIYSSGIEHFATGKFERNGIRNSGEDNELSFWVKLIGFDLYFSRDLNLEHLITKDRLTKEARDKLEFGIRNGTKLLNRNLKILNKSLTVKRKLDYFNIVKFNDNGIISRLKLGLYFRKSKLANNRKVLVKLINQYQDKLNANF